MTVEKDTVSDDAILDDVFASDRDRGADSAASEPQAKPVQSETEVEADEAKTEGEDGQSKQYRDPENGRFVPLTELKTERTKRQEEARLRVEWEQRAIAAEARAEEARRYAEQFQRQQQQYQQPQPQQPQAPDPFTDPEAYQQYVENRAQTAVFSERLNMSQMMAEEKHGAEKVAKALEVAGQAGIIPHLLRTRNPYAELMTWHARQEAFAEIGPDPSVFKANFEKQVREKVLAELKSGGSQSQQRFPGTLSDASAAGSQVRALSDEAIVDDIFASDRKRRA